MGSFFRNSGHAQKSPFMRSFPPRNGFSQQVPDLRAPPPLPFYQRRRARLEVAVAAKRRDPPREKRPRSSVKSEATSASKGDDADVLPSMKPVPIEIALITLSTLGPPVNSTDAGKAADRWSLPSGQWTSRMPGQDSPRDSPLPAVRPRPQASDAPMRYSELTGGPSYVEHMRQGQETPTRPLRRAPVLEIEKPSKSGSQRLKIERGPVHSDSRSPSPDTPPVLPVPVPIRPTAPPLPILRPLPAAPARSPR
jgi:hypothetical protein